MINMPGGIAIQRDLFSNDAKKVFDIAVAHRRQIVDLPKAALRGFRFKNDLGVLARLESMFTEAQFMACPGITIDAALIDAAQADWWYSNEKDYGNECEVDDDGE
jgi:hypothetical protein